MPQQVFFTLANLIVARIIAGRPPKPPKAPEVPGPKDRIFEIQDPVAPREIVYGVQRKSGNRVFVEGSTDKQFIHIVVTLASHEIEAIDEVFLNNDPIHADDISTDSTTAGEVNAGKYSGKVFIKKHLGTDGQTADADLVGVGGWTSSHRLRGIAYLYVRLELDQDLFPGPRPNISAWIKGKKVTETRDSAEPLQFTTNPALILRDYLTTSENKMGLGFDITNEINDTTIDAAANICDQEVTVVDVSKTVTNVDTTSDFVDFATDKLLIFQLGDQVDVTSSGTVPGGLGTGLYALPYRRSQALLADNTVHANVSMQFASSLENAWAGTAIVITSAGSGTITVTKKAEPRYSAGGVLESTTEPLEAVENILSSMGGKAVHIGGTWSIFAAGYISPTISLDDGDLRSDLTVQTKRSRRERFNAVKGKYVSPLKNGVVSDYPPVVNALYKTEDNEIRIWGELNFDFVSRAHQAQRLAKIELEKHRQQITVDYPSKIPAFQLQPTDTVQITNDILGWSDKIFEVAETSLVRVSTDDTDVPSLVCDLQLVETASGIYDWNSGEETLVDLAPDTNLPNPFIVGAPTGLDIVTEQFTDTVSGALNSSLRLTWTVPSDFFVSQDGKIEIQFKESSTATYIGNFFVPGSETTASIRQVVDSIAYDIRVRAINNLGVRSTFNTVSAYIVGSTFDPSVSRIDRRFVIESVGLAEDWGAVTDTPASADHRDYGDVL